MRGIWFERGRIEVRRKLQLPEPPAGEALVRVLRAGICNTDMELVKGYCPYRGAIGMNLSAWSKKARPVWWASG